MAGIAPYGTETLASEFIDWSGADRIEINGTSNGDTINWSATAGDASTPSATIRGGAGNDTLSSGGFHNYIDGGEDADTFVLTGDIAEYTFTPLAGDPDVLRISDNRVGAPDGIDDLVGVELVQFANDGTVDVSRILTAPVAVADTGLYTFTDTSIEVDVVMNDFSPDGDAISLASATSPSGGTASVIYSPTAGRDVVEFTPDAGFVGMASVDYTITDPFGNTDTAHVRIAIGPRAPEAITLDWSDGNAKLGSAIPGTVTRVVVTRAPGPVDSSRRSSRTALLSWTRSRIWSRPRRAHKPLAVRQFRHHRHTAQPRRLCLRLLRRRHHRHRRRQRHRAPQRAWTASRPAAATTSSSSAATWMV